MLAMKSKNYKGIDVFRLIAAFLVIAIHTSPLISFSELGDFMLTRIIARIAVPFFMMASGFFIISKYDYEAKRLKKFLKKTALIYGGAMLVYVPVNIYNGYFLMENLVPNVIRDIVFDGTLYHLWYLPASMIGAAVASYTVKRLGYGGALAVTAVLYLVGLFGDSYYGLGSQMAVVKGFYPLVFQVSDYTRNGIFFAPVFFVLGGVIADQRQRGVFAHNICGFAISMAFMFAEALKLHELGWQRHDSMYIFLLPCMYFLFRAILTEERPVSKKPRGKSMAWLRTFSLVIYIIHPMMIVLVRLVAKFLGLWDILVGNSIVHYFVVCLASVVTAFAFCKGKQLLERKGGRLPLMRKRSREEKTFCEHTVRAWIEIDLANLAHNVKVLKGAMPRGCRMMAVVKANAYGHGAAGISLKLNQWGVESFAVATIDEGIELRKCGVRGEILVLGYTSVSRAAQLKEYDLMQTLVDFEYAAALNRVGVPVRAHIKIDTGMHRLGILSSDFLKVKKVFAMQHINICGMFTHLCCPDGLAPDDVQFTTGQITEFFHLLGMLREVGIKIPKIHIQSSYGLLNYPELRCDYARIGIALYGVSSTPQGETKWRPDLRPVLSVKARVALVRTIGRGEHVGYNRRFTAQRDTRIAILPIGYGDGFPRNLSCGKSNVILHGKPCPVIGRICMDQLAVDITEAGHVCVGDTATLVGAEGHRELAVPDIAERSGSISNELLCRLGARLPVVTVN